MFANNYTTEEAAMILQTERGALRVRKSSSLEQVLEAFILTQDVKPTSRALYKRVLSLFFRYLEEQRLNINQLTEAELIEYKESLFARGLSSLSVASYLTALRKFFGWAEANKLYPNIMKNVKTPKRKQQFKKMHLENEESARLLEAASLSPRDYAILNLMLRGGLRCIEVTRANIEDVVFKAGKRLLKVWGKGRDTKEDFIILTDKAWKPIEAYLSAERRNAKGGEPLFVSRSHRDKGERLTTRSVSRIAKENLKKIGLDAREYTAHSLRHTTAVTILRQGGRVEDAQAVLRHTTPTTTQIYLESIKEEERLKKASESLIDNAF